MYKCIMLSTRMHVFCPFVYVFVHIGMFVSMCSLTRSVLLSRTRMHACIFKDLKRHIARSIGVHFSEVLLGIWCKITSQSFRHRPSFDSRDGNLHLLLFSRWLCSGRWSRAQTHPLTMHPQGRALSASQLQLSLHLNGREREACRYVGAHTAM